MDTGLMLTAAAISIVLLALAVSFTRADPRRTLAALVGGALAGLLNIGWDLAASRAGLSQHIDGAQAAGWTTWLPVALALGAAAGLVGWRMTRAWGLGGLLLFLAIFAALGVLRDTLYGARGLGFLFGDGIAPWLADAAGWLALGLVIQATMRLLGGPAKMDGPARSRS